MVEHWVEHLEITPIISHILLTQIINKKFNKLYIVKIYTKNRKTKNKIIYIYYIYINGNTNKKYF